ncbi:hypothetical protein Ocin01_15482 [Orchesella cincta]|uniref:Uncharacterized protein n=1 Tax=Orchesella cincta TaxID=48709 RepID=A0A1D2MDY3_ORCCI|nr:hypothetical protein Ocin01_15482 [Orchesella cincta]
MVSNSELTSEVERITGMLQQNPPLLHDLMEKCEKFSDRYTEFIKIRLPPPAMSHPHPIFTELRMEYVRISEVERELNKQYCIFWNKVDDALKLYNYVEKAMKDIGQAAGASGIFSETQFAKLRQLFESDKNYALFNGLSANIPSLLADEWEHLNIIQPLTDCIHRMDTLKAKMNLELQAFAN